MNHPFTFIKSRASLCFVHWSLWMFTVDEMRMKTAFTPFTLDESSAIHIQSLKCKFALSQADASGGSAPTTDLDLPPKNLQNVKDQPTKKCVTEYCIHILWICVCKGYVGVAPCACSLSFFFYPK